MMRPVTNSTLMTEALATTAGEVPLCDVDESDSMAPASIDVAAEEGGTEIDETAMDWGIIERLDGRMG
jgi:hypothetical protein